MIFLKTFSRNSAVWGDVGRSFHQWRTPTLRVQECDFVSLCDGTMRCRSLIAGFWNWLQVTLDKSSCLKWPVSYLKSETTALLSLRGCFIVDWSHFTCTQLDPGDIQLNLEAVPSSTFSLWRLILVSSCSHLPNSVGGLISDLLCGNNELNSIVMAQYS